VIFGTGDNAIEMRFVFLDSLSLINMYFRDDLLVYTSSLTEMPLFKHNLNFSNELDNVFHFITSSQSDIDIG